MSKSLLENIYGTLFSPVETFNSITKEEKPPVFEAFLIVILVSIIGAMTHFQGKSFFFLGFNLITYVIFAILSWVFVASIIDGLATIFCRLQKFDTLIVLTAFALIPWILIAPIDLFKVLGIGGTLFAMIIELVVWIWTTILFLLAISRAYDLSGGKVILLAVMPLLGTIIAFYWIVGFITNIISIATV